MPFALPAYNFRRVKGGGVLFVLLWNLLVFSYQESALGDLADLVVRRIGPTEPYVVVIIGALLSSSFLPRLLYPFAGWLADAKLGRYKVMRYSLWAMWIGSALLVVMSTVRYLIIEYEPVSHIEANDDLHYYIVPVVVIYLINAVGLAGYHVNVIPFGIDQMEGASGEQIASFVHWYYWTRNFNFGVIIQGIPTFKFDSKYCKNQDKYFTKTVDISLLLAQMTFLTAAVCLDFVFSNKLHKDVKTHSTVKKVKDISTFVARHSQPVGHRRAYTFTYEAPASRSDFAKKSYGGPYKDEEVEEVMSFWRIVTVLLTVGFGSFLIENVSLKMAGIVASYMNCIHEVMCCVLFLHAGISQLRKLLQALAGKCYYRLL